MSESYESAEENPNEGADDSEPEQSDKASDYDPASENKKKSPKKSLPKKKTPAKAKGRGRPPKVRRGRPPKREKSPVNSDADSEEEYEVEAIVGHREYNGKLVYKIHWKNYESKFDSWEDYRSLNCPDLLEMYNLKHKVSMPKKQAGMKRKSNNNKKKASKVKKPLESSSEQESDESFEADDKSVELNDPEDPLADEYEVQRIRDMRVKGGKREFLVHWKKWSPEHDTWEPEENLSCQDLIDKFLEEIEENKKKPSKELRFNRKTTDRFTLHTKDGGRRLSRRNDKTQRVKYYDAELSDE